MSVRLALDNNILDAILKYHEQPRIIGYFRSRRFSFYPSPELLDEVIGLYQKNPKKLSEKLELFLAISTNKIFQPWRTIISNELRKSCKGIFLESRISERIFSNLKRIKDGTYHAPAEVVELVKLVKSEKEKQKRYFSDIRSDVLPKVKGLERPSSFDAHFESGEIVRQRKKFLDFFLGQSPCPETADHIISNSHRYPYYSASARVLHGLYYMYHAKGREVDEGDYFDACQLIYLAGLDYFVTNEKRIKEWDDVFFKSKKVINFDEFLKLL